MKQIEGLPEIRLLSIDQSMASTGWTFFTTVYGVIPVGPKFNWIQTMHDPNDPANIARLASIHIALGNLFEELKPTHVVSEMFFAKSARGTLACGEVRGLIKLQCWKHNVKFIEMPVQTVRKDILGKGNALKEDAETWVNARDPEFYRILLSYTQPLKDTKTAKQAAINRRQDITDSYIMAVAALNRLSKGEPQ